ncbi:hypothetical protein DM02DRAFT_82030 [Periconia macrospinosa]|uniref:Uncharacterized protein n=1 Tax=Periconia macrospinosa TaxID=97972 RepID=A0A2V1DIC8_9PLEO|nr:hypothetical protein DM02DRAFT_82030 [Periconia macrospinosa]
MTHRPADLVHLQEDRTACACGDTRRALPCSAFVSACSFLRLLDSNHRSPKHEHPTKTTHNPRPATRYTSLLLFARPAHRFTLVCPVGLGTALCGNCTCPCFLLPYVWMSWLLRCTENIGFSVE